MTTIVMNGTGPRIKINSGANSKMILVSKNKITNLALKDKSTVKFAA